jgi:hypothetical protein
VLDKLGATMKFGAACFNEADSVWVGLNGWVMRSVKAVFAIFLVAAYAR